MLEITFVADLWRWKGNSAWHFITVPVEESAEVAELAAGPRAGFGSVKVEARIGETVWRTSLFPQEDQFLLPVKKAVRVAEQLEVDDPVEITLVVPPPA
jgi:hypothetical protein